jgi:tetratricopeptide (TPR) repeat protein
VLATSKTSSERFETRKRQCKQALDAYEAALRDGWGPAPGGRGDPAEQWYRKAADGGDADAMFNLGPLLAEQGEEDQAEQWYRKAVDTGRRDG